MGQKVHPVGIRLGIVKDWASTWYADSKHYPDYLNEDLRVRAFLKKKLSQASVSRIQIERPARNARTSPTKQPAGAGGGCSAISSRIKIPNTAVIATARGRNK